MNRLWCILCLATIGAAALWADPAREGFYLDQSVQGAYDPLGFQLTTKLFHRQPLGSQQGMLWEGTKIDLGAVNNLSPAYDLVGGFIDILPVAFFDLTLSAQFAGYYSAFGYGFHSLSSYDSAFDDAALNALPAKNTTGYVLSASPTLQFAFGPVVVVDSFAFTYFNVDGGEGLFYEAISNCVLAKSGVELQNQAYLLAKLSPELMVGLNDSLLHIPASGYESHAIHLTGIYTKQASERLAVYSALMVGTFLADRYYQYALHLAGQVGVTLTL